MAPPSGDGAATAAAARASVPSRADARSVARVAFTLPLFAGRAKVPIPARGYAGGALRSTRALRTLAWGAVAVGIATPLVRHRLRLRPPVVSALTWPAPAALALAAPRTPLRDAGIYALQMWTYFAHFDMPDDDPEKFLQRVKVRYPITLDRVIGLGTTPTVRLQRALARDREPGPLEYGLSMVHWSWFLVPHGTCAYILLRHRRYFERSAVLMAACFDAGCVVYWLLPTAPPWWASRNGDLPPVRRIMAEAGERFWGRLWDPLYSSLQGNPFAAMPSLHFGTSAMAARLLSQIGPGTALSAGPTR